MSELRMPGIFSVPSLPVLILLFLAAMTMPGCQSVNPFQGFGLEKRSPEENRIRKLMRWHSGKVEVYRDFRTVFSARAVFISDGVREALVDWQARTRLLDPGEKEDLHRSMFGEGGVRQVLVGFYTPDEDMNAIGGEEEPWIVFLERPDGTAARATCSEVLEDERDMYMRFLEWDLSWSRLYMLCFPDDREGPEGRDGWVRLVISGSGGRGEMVLKTSPPPQ